MSSYSNPLPNPSGKSSTELTVAKMTDPETTGRLQFLDFQQRRDVEGWQAVDDRVMGGLSSSAFTHHPEGFAVFAGVVLLDNGGGFASVRHPHLLLGDGTTEAYRLRVRGDGKRYKLNLRMDDIFDGVNHQAVFQPPVGRWVDIVLPLSMFSPRLRGRAVPDAPSLEPGRVQQVGWMVGDRQAGEFRLEIQYVQCLGRPPAASGLQTE